MEAGRASGVGLGGGRSVGPEDPLPKGVPSAALASSGFPGEAVARAASFLVATCSEAGWASLLRLPGGEQDERRRKGRKRDWGEKEPRLGKGERTCKNSLPSGSPDWRCFLTCGIEAGNPAFPNNPDALGWPVWDVRPTLPPSKQGPL